MNDEIKVGDYIRTDDGYIAKVLEIDEKGGYDCDGIIQNSYGDELDFYFDGEIDITKHSPNIIDLIEVGDYVNRHLVVEKADSHICIENIDEDDGGEYVSEKGIKAILTKEQFEKVMYRVEE